MKIIDAHVHFSNIAAFKNCAEHTSLVDYSAEGYLRETEANGVARSVCMGLTETNSASFPDEGSKTPMLADFAETLPKGMLLCLGINPHTLSNESVDELERLAGGGAAGFKIYAGYYRFNVFDPVYGPVYDVAERHNLPIVIHSGETYSQKGLLEYSHPLAVDRLAVERPGMKIVICHMGAPWINEAASIACKNGNVYLDISGLIVEKADKINSMANKPLVIGRYAQALELLDRYDRVLYGSDWPLAPMGAYINFCKRIVPPEFWAEVFYLNACRVFNINNDNKN